MCSGRITTVNTITMWGTQVGAITLLRPKGGHFYCEAYNSLLGYYYCKGALFIWHCFMDAICMVLFHIVMTPLFLKYSIWGYCATQMQEQMGQQQAQYCE